MWDRNASAFRQAVLVPHRRGDVTPLVVGEQPGDAVLFEELDALSRPATKAAFAKISPNHASEATVVTPARPHATARPVAGSMM
jgi:hypothetical protein